MAEPLPATNVQISRGRYQPLVLVLIALCTGIAADRFFPQAASVWWLAAGGAMVIWLAAWHKGYWQVSTWVLLAAVAASGAAWHHFRWNLFSADDLGLCITEAPQAVCVEAIALCHPRRVPAPSFNPMRTIPRGDHSRLTVRPVKIRNGRTWRPVTGKADLTVEGHLLGVRTGDRLRIFAQLSAPRRPRNPGDFDAAQHNRTERKLCHLGASFPDCVSVVERGSAWSPSQILNAVRERCDKTLWRHVGHQRAGLAAAVLLGAREQLDEDRTEDFFATGSIHLLAISGLHVGILVYFFWLAARTTLLTRRAALVAAAVFVVLYALLTDARPPVVRAAVLIVVLCTARLLWRQTLAFNSLAAAGIFVLMLNPAQSFQVGTQLSFLAVATLACCGHWLGPRAPQDPLDRLIAHSRPWPVRSAKRFGSVVWRLCLTSTVIWLVALPLIMYRFNLLSPVAVVLNPVLWLPTAIALFSGFGVLIFGWLMPPLAAACGWLCSVSLASIEICTHAARHIPGSHFFGPAPALWWVAAFYAALGLLVAFPELRPPRRWCVALICAWIAIGLATSNMMRPRQSDEQPLDCTFLAVGHGTSVVVELPGRKTLLYDSGCFSSPAGAARSITACLWSRGITHIDAIVISHADADHYNALPELLERVSVGVVYVSPVMFQESSPALAWLRAAIEDAGVPIRELAAGDRLQASDHVQMEVLHPLPRGVAGSDNANSIVLEINYCGKRILLPGDLETPGLEDVLDEEPRDYDCVMAPHHGSVRSNPRGFVAWSTPEWVVISGGYERDLDKVIAAYQTSAASVLHTARDGAVRVTLDREQIRVQSWRNDQWR